MTLHGEEANIGRYSFGYSVEAKTFCRVCGVNLTNTRNALSDNQVSLLPTKIQEFYRMPLTEHAVNARVLDGVDIEKLRIKRFDEAAEDPAMRNEYINP